MDNVSCDSFLGLPFNIASYALLTEMYAHVCNMIPGDFVWTGGDTHIYVNHFNQIQLQLSRDPKPLPYLRFARKVDSIFDFKLEDIIVEGYDPHPKIVASVAI